MFVIRFGTRSERGCVAPLLATCIWFRKKDHCNTGCNLDTRTTEGTPRKKEKGIFAIEYLAVPSDTFLEFSDFDSEAKVEHEAGEPLESLDAQPRG